MSDASSIVAETASARALGATLYDLPSAMRARGEQQASAALMRCVRAVCERRLFGASSAPVELGTSTFDVIGRLGAGGMGAVFEVEQHGRVGRMALKLLHRTGADQLHRLKREFRVLAGLAHPNLVTLYELIADGESCAFSMELVTGEDFVSYSRPAGTLQLDRLRAALRGIATGLRALHAAEIVHRDLKPSNVLVTPEGRAVLLDFGVALEGPEAEVSGTRAFMPEEQARGETVPASDLYALGTMLSLALFDTLEPPATCQDPSLLPWAELTHTLLRKNPSERPSADELVAWLDGETRTPRAALTAPTFVGRERELALLLERCSRAEAGPELLVLEGASGLGKSALLARLSTELDSMREVLFLAGRCSPREAVRYRALDPLLDALGTFWKGLPRARATALVPQGALALTTLFPTLTRVSALAERAAGESEIADARERRRVAVSALREVLSRLAQSLRVVICIDDAHWMDDDSRELIVELTREPKAPSLLFLLFARPSSDADQATPEGDTAHATGATNGSDAAVKATRFAALSTHIARSKELALDPLDAQTARSLVSALMPEQPELWQRVLELSAGVPFLLAQLGALARETPALSQPENLEQALEARVTKLEALPRRLLELTTIAEEPLSYELLREVLGESDVGIMRALSSLEAARFVRALARGPLTLEPYHARVAELVRRTLSAAARATYHRSLGGVMEARDATHHAKACAYHFREAGEPSRAARHALVAADAAAARLAFFEAAELYQSCLTLVPDHPERSRLMTRTAEVLVSAGRDVDAAEVLRALADETDDPRLQDDLIRRSAELLLKAGQGERGLARLRPVLARADAAPPESRLASLLSLLWRRALLWWRGLDYQLRPVDEIDPAELARVDACLSVATFLGGHRVMWGIDFGTRAVLYALEAGERTRLTQALLVESVLRAIERDGAPSRRALDEAHKLAALSGDEALLAQVHFAEAQCALIRLDHAGLKRHAALALKLLTERCTGVTSQRAAVRYLSLFARFACGETTRLSDDVAEGLREACARGDVVLEYAYRDYDASLLLAAGDPSAARASVEASLAAWQGAEVDVRYWGHVTLACQIDLYEGRYDLARVRLERLLPAFHRHGLMLVPVTRTLTYYLHALTLLRVPGKRAERQLSRYARKLSREPFPVAQNLGLQLSAALCARRGQIGEAARRLERAGAQFERDGTRRNALASKVLAARLRRDLPAERALVDELKRDGVIDPMCFLAGSAPFAIDGDPT